MSLLSKLFGGGGGGKPPAEPEEYKGFASMQTPNPKAAKYRLGARIEKDVDGEVLTHTLIRADMLDTLEDAITVSTAKAKQVIDEQSDGIFR